MPKPFDLSLLEHGILLPVRATVAEMDAAPTEEMTAALNDAIARVRAEKAGAKAVAELAPIGSNNKPRMLQISAWICHAGYPNGNNEGFSEAALKDVVEAGLFAPPYMGMVDFNHDFTAIGAWYKAEYKFDDVAGAWGIFAHGAIWSWRYGAQADRLLAMQQRNGHIDVSIACFYTQSERVRNPDTGLGWTMITNPVFMTTSVLDVDPADPKSRGLASEDPDQSENDRTLALLKATLATLAAEANTSTEELMDELLKKITALLGEQKAELQPLIDAVAALDVAKTELATVTASNASNASLLATAQTTIAGLQAQLDAKITEAQTLTVSAEALTTTITEQTTELETLRAFKAEADAKVETETKATRNAARMKEIPAAVLAQLDIEKNEENKALVQKWLDQSDEEWTGTVKLFAVAAAARPSLAERTERQGVLPSISDVDLGTHRIARFLKK